MIAAMLLLTTVLQVAAAVWALLLLRKIPKARGWVLFVLALTLMAARQGALYYFWVREAKPLSGAIPVDVGFSLLISAVLLLAVASTGKMFASSSLDHTAARTEALERERRQFAELISRLPFGVVVEYQHGLAFANKFFSTMVGADAAALSGKRFQDFVLEEDREKLASSYEKSSDGTGRVEVQMLRGDGTSWWAAVRWLTGIWEGRNATFWVTADITDRKQRELERAATEALFSQGPVVLIRWRPKPQRNVAFVSENVRAWGFDPQVLMKDSDDFYKYAHPQDRARVQREAQAHFARGATSWSQKYRLLCPDGKTLWVYDRTVVVKNPAGEVVAFDGYLLDVSEAMEAEQLLAKERARYAAALEATGEVVYEWDIASGKIVWNRNVTKAFGYTVEEMGGITDWAERIHPEDRDRVERSLAACTAFGRPFQEEYRFRRADSSYAYVLDRGIVERDENGHPVRMVGAMADVSQTVQLQEQLAAARRLETIGQLVGGIAHDFNNILTVISGAADFARRKLPADHAVQVDLDAIHESSERAAKLVRNLLAFARKQVIAPIPLDLNAHLRKSMDMLRRLLPENITLDFIPGRNLGTIMVDPLQLDQVILNLVVNARDAMPHGGIVTLETENVLINGRYVELHPWAKEGRYVLLSVSDTGEGMDEATRQKAFEPFFTTKEPGKGSGLGLATVYGIVKQHDGMVNIYSEVGKGTTVKIYLPITERRAIEVGSKVEGSMKGGTETILVVEDEKTVREVLAESLRALGYQVFTAEDGRAALALLEDRGFAVDLVLSDVVMPNMGGWELFQLVREKAPQVKFLFSTGYSENAVHTNFVKKEGVYLITKPYGLDALGRKVREIFDAGTRKNGT
ncbi:MAG: PAS domain-containing protein [Thermoanaerobaculaceae bacterium]